MPSVECDGSIAHMTSTPDEPDWLQLAEEALADSDQKDDGLQDSPFTLMHWRYRTTVG